jgi:hypothetical protein
MNAQTDTLEEYEAFLYDKSVTHAQKVQKTLTNFNGIYKGWDKPQYHTKQSCSSKTATCNLNCKLKVHTGFGTKNKHGHMMEHVREMLRLVKVGAIKKPRSIPLPELEDRPTGPGLTIGSRNKEGHRMTQQRQKKWIEYMHAAKRNPEIYSRCVSLPAQGRNLMGKKIEVRISIDLDPDRR